jgi:hypothetical protein
VKEMLRVTLMRGERVGDGLARSVDFLGQSIHSNGAWGRFSVFVFHGRRISVVSLQPNALAHDAFFGEVCAPRLPGRAEITLFGRFLSGRFQKKVSV